MSNGGTRQAGWYPDERIAGTLRFWDGEGWTDKIAPAPPRQSGPSVSRGVVAVAVGALVAAAVVFGVWQLSQPSELDCATQRANYAVGNVEAYEMDDACR